LKSILAVHEPARRAGIQQTLAEVEGAIVLPGLAGPFTLTARADRIDTSDKGLVITDYKTSIVKDLTTRPAQTAVDRIIHAPVRRHHRLNRVSRKEADSAQPLKLGRPVLPQTPQSKGAVKLSELSAARRHHPPVQVRVSVAAAQSGDNRATANLARRRVVLQVPARREAEKSVGSLLPINLQPRRLSVQVQLRAKCAVDGRERKAPMVNLPGSQEAERQLRLSKGRRNPQRKKERQLQRQGRNNFC